MSKDHAAKRRMMLLKSLVIETAKFARSGFKTRTIEEQADVIAICEPCELYKVSPRWGPQCSKCGCCMNVKKKWITAHCPIGKW